MFGGLQHVEADALTACQVESSLETIVLSPKLVHPTEESSVALHCTGVVWIHPMKPLRVRRVDRVIANNSKTTKAISQHAVLSRALRVDMTAGENGSSEKL